MAVLKWSRLEEEVDVTSLPDNQARSGGWNLVRNLGASLALLVLVLFLVISRSEQQGRAAGASSRSQQEQQEKQE